LAQFFKVKVPVRQFIKGSVAQPFTIFDRQL